jgi:hypothetical protein
VLIVQRRGDRGERPLGLDIACHTVCRLPGAARFHAGCTRPYRPEVVGGYWWV